MASFSATSVPKASPMRSPTYANKALDKKMLWSKDLKWTLTRADSAIMIALKLSSKNKRRKSRIINLKRRIAFLRL